MAVDCRALQYSQCLICLARSDNLIILYHMIMIIFQDFKPIRLHEKTLVRNLRNTISIVLLQKHAGGQHFSAKYYSALKMCCGGPNSVLGSKLVNIVQMSPLLWQW